MLSENIKYYRNRLGFTQELLAEKAGVTTRTIQRVENGETTPRADTISRIAGAMNLQPSDLLQYQKKVDPCFLTGLCASAFSSLLFPLLGVLVPYILWTMKKDQIERVKQIGRDLINYQITWNLSLIFAFTGYYTWFQYSFSSVSEITLSLPKLYWSVFFILFGSLYLFNFILLSLNIYLISNRKDTWFKPKIKFIRT